MKPRIERQVAKSRRRLQTLRKFVAGKGLAKDRRLNDLFDELAESIDAVSVAVCKMSSANDQLADAQLAASLQARHYEDLFRFAPEAYVATDERGVIQELNAAAERLFGRARRHLIGKPLLSLVAPADGDQFLARLSALRDRSRPVGEQPLRFGSDPGFDAEISASSRRHAEAVEIR
ncbi:MAG: PAS domain-containing protein, partial [Deltaproteobacteria bacterium]